MKWALWGPWPLCFACVIVIPVARAQGKHSLSHCWHTACSPSCWEMGPIKQRAPLLLPLPYRELHHCDPMSQHKRPITSSNGTNHLELSSSASYGSMHESMYDGSGSVVSTTDSEDSHASGSTMGVFSDTGGVYFMNSKYVFMADKHLLDADWQSDLSVTPQTASPAGAAKGPLHRNERLRRLPCGNEHEPLDASALRALLKNEPPEVVEAALRHLSCGNAPPDSPALSSLRSRLETGKPPDVGNVLPFGREPPEVEAAAASMPEEREGAGPPRNVPQDVEAAAAPARDPLESEPAGAAQAPEAHPSLNDRQRVEAASAAAVGHAPPEGLALGAAGGAVQLLRPQDEPVDVEAAAGLLQEPWEREAAGASQPLRPLKDRFDVEGAVAPSPQPRGGHASGAMDGPTSPLHEPSDVEGAAALAQGPPKNGASGAAPRPQSPLSEPPDIEAAARRALPRNAASSGSFGGRWAADAGGQGAAPGEHPPHARSQSAGSCHSVSSSGSSASRASARAWPLSPPPAPRHRDSRGGPMLEGDLKPLMFRPHDPTDIEAEAALVAFEARAEPGPVPGGSGVGPLLTCSPESAPESSLSSGTTSVVDAAYSPPPSLCDTTRSLPGMSSPFSGARRSRAASLPSATTMQSPPPLHLDPTVAPVEVCVCVWVCVCGCVCVVVIPNLNTQRKAIITNVLRGIL